MRTVNQIMEHACELIMIRLTIKNKSAVKEHDSQ